MIFLLDHTSPKWWHFTVLTFYLKIPSKGKHPKENSSKWYTLLLVKGEFSRLAHLLENYCNYTNKSYFIYYIHWLFLPIVSRYLETKEIGSIHSIQEVLWHIFPLVSMYVYILRMYRASSYTGVLTWPLLLIFESL